MSYAAMLSPALAPLFRSVCQFPRCPLGAYGSPGMATAKVGRGLDRLYFLDFLTQPRRPSLTAKGRALAAELGVEVRP